MKENVDLRKITSVLLLALFTALLLTGCKMFAKPEEGIKTYAEAVGHFDEEAAKKVGVDLDALKENREKPAVAAFEAMAPGMLDADKVKGLTNALYGRMKTLQLKTELVSKEGDKARVKVTTESIDYLGIVPDVAEDLRADIEQEQDKIAAMPQGEGVQYLMGKMFDKLQKGVEKAETKGENSFEVDAKYDDKLGQWVPENPDTFNQDLYQAMMDSH